jgi:hypothetical protein
MKLLYSQSTLQILPYPRNDDGEIIGLDSDYLVLTRVETRPLDYDAATQSISSEFIVDLDSLEYRQVWTVTDIEPTITAPNWGGFYDALIVTSTYQYLIANTVPHPSISGAMAAMGIAILQGQSDLSNPNRLEAFQASVSGVLAALSAVNLTLTPEMLAEVRSILDANGFNSEVLN